MKMVINDEIFIFKENTIAITAPNQIISISCDPHAINEGYLMFFSLDFLDLKTNTPLEYEFPYFKMNANAIFELTIDTKITNIVLEHIYQEFIEKGFMFKEIIRSYMLVVFNIINRSYLKLETKLPITDLKSKQYVLVSQFDAKIQQHLPKRPSIQTIAQELFVSVKYLNEAIKNITDKTSTQYLNEIIMLEAKKLLLHTNFSINEIAYQLEYTDPSYFIKVFKIHFKMTPMEYRKKEKF